MKAKIPAKLNESIKDYCHNHPEIEVAYIFGSVAQNLTSALSDIDIAILIDYQQIDSESYRYGYKAAVLADLIKLLKTTNIDLVILNKTSPLLRHRILYYGTLLYSKTESKRIAFHTSTIDKYIDFKYLIKPHHEIGVTID